VQFISKYPAVLSGYVIYSYLFVSIMRLFIKVHYYGGNFSDVIDLFSPLPFMWFLSVSLVKVIEYRTKLHESESLLLRSEKELQTKATQLETLHQTVLGLQHEVNNPLAIITLAIGGMRRRGLDHQASEHMLDLVDDASRRIGKSLEKLSQTDRYDLHYIHPDVGPMVVLPKERILDSSSS
jgi:hypothetical protein